MGKMVESNKVKLIRLEEKFNYMGKDIIQIKKSLEGNGQPGFVNRLENVEKKLSEFHGVTKILGIIFGSSLTTGLIVFIIGKLFN